LNRVVLVTGASSGIGEGIAIAFARAGATVYGTTRTDAALHEARERHGQIRWLRMDVRDAGACRVAIESVVKEAERLDVLVNNAGVARLRPLQETSVEDVAVQFETNVYGPTYLTRAALAALQSSKGSIVNVSSVAGHKPNRMGALYAASKAALESLTRSWALELAPHGVRVNAVAPGPVRTPIFSKVGLPPEAIASMIDTMSKTLPLQRVGEPADIAPWVLALSDPSVSWVTGQVLSVDGGMGLG
jgi:NAD(P)-dependent dehydrogenase (short-subunit alcohol dehydrogenase family)